MRGFTKHFWYKILDDTGTPIPSASVFVYDHNSSITELNLFDSNEDVLSQPIMSDANGVVEFYVKDNIRSSADGYVWDKRFIISWSKDDKSGIIRGDHLFGEFKAASISSNTNRLNRTINNYLGWRFDEHVDFRIGFEHKCGYSSSSSSSSTSISSSSSSSSESAVAPF